MEFPKPCILLGILDEQSTVTVMLIKRVSTLGQITAVGVSCPSEVSHFISELQNGNSM
jgi:hypothetical protein